MSKESLTQRHGFRKLSFGLAGVALATTFLAVKPTTAHAATGNNGVETTTLTLKQSNTADTDSKAGAPVVTPDPDKDAGTSKKNEASTKPDKTLKATDQNQNPDNGKMPGKESGIQNTQAGDQSGLAKGSQSQSGDQEAPSQTGKKEQQDTQGKTGTKPDGQPSDQSKTTPGADQGKTDPKQDNKDKQDKDQNKTDTKDDQGKTDSKTDKKVSPKDTVTDYGTPAEVKNFDINLPKEMLQGQVIPGYTTKKGDLEFLTDAQAKELGLKQPALVNGKPVNAGQYVAILTPQGYKNLTQWVNGSEVKGKWTPDPDTTTNVKMPKYDLKALVQLGLFSSYFVNAENVTSNVIGTQTVEVANGAKWDPTTLDLTKFTPSAEPANKDLAKDVSSALKDFKFSKGDLAATQDVKNKSIYDVALTKAGLAHLQKTLGTNYKVLAGAKYGQVIVKTTTDDGQTASVVINFEDNATHKIVKSSTVKGNVGETVKLNLQVPAGYELINGEKLPTEYKFTGKDAPMNIKVQKKNYAPGYAHNPFFIFGQSFIAKHDSGSSNEQPDEQSWMTPTKDSSKSMTPTEGSSSTSTKVVKSDKAGNPEIIKAGKAGTSKNAKKYGKATGKTTIDNASYPTRRGHKTAAEDLASYVGKTKGTKSTKVSDSASYPVNHDKSATKAGKAVLPQTGASSSASAIAVGAIMLAASASLLGAERKRRRN